MPPKSSKESFEAVPKSERNRSLERGIQILRAFRPGADLLGNGELSDRTGLPRATVSRLAQTLVDCGMLEHDRSGRAYRLAAPVLSLAHAMRAGSPVLTAAGPLMRSVAEHRKINVGLAVADGDEMVYLESVRYSRRVAWRNVVAGQRVPIELTSLGRVWLASVDLPQRNLFLTRLRGRRASGWKDLSKDIGSAISDVKRLGYCWACWQPQVVAIAAPVFDASERLYALNMSVSGDVSPSDVVEELHEPLLALATQIEAAIGRIR